MRGCTKIDLANPIPVVKWLSDISTRVVKGDTEVVE
jgi:hypothetical protein